MSKPETLPEIAERLEGSLAHQILAALREVEARGEQRAAKLGGALLDSAVERAEKAEAENARLKALIEWYLMNVADNEDGHDFVQEAEDKFRSAVAEEPKP